MTRHHRARSRLLVGASLLTGAGLVAAAVGPSIAGAAPKPRISLEPIGTYATGQFDESAAEIVAHDPETQQLFVVNAQKGAIDVLDISDPENPTEAATLTASGPVNSVAVSDGFVAVAVEADPSQDPGSVQFFDIDDLAAGAVATVEVGALPDMLTFTPDGTKVVVANEGEPDRYCLTDDEGNPAAGDPEGSISIIDVSGGVENVVQGDVSTADFTAFNSKITDLRAAGVRIFGPEATVAQDLEPEYVVVDADSSTAWVALQENNALAIVDLETAEVTDVVALGFKDHSVPGNALDPSNRDDAIAIANWPVKGMYQPDGMDAYEFGNRTFIVTANEGDARDYDCYSEEERITDLELDASVFPPELQEILQQEENLGRLNSTISFDTTSLERDAETEVFVPEVEPATELYSYGARSFSIWDEAGNLVFDSGDDFERITADLIPADFNSNNDDNDSFDSRSDDKGPEPEAVEIARVYSKTYAFIGLERVGGIMVYDITTPRNPKFVQYVNNRDFSVEDPADPAAGDLGPEGLAFIAPEDSPNGRPLLAVANEVSGTTTLFEIDGPGRRR